MDSIKQLQCYNQSMFLTKEEVIMLRKSLELGELYKELRIARGLKLKDISKKNLSISQLSKFENGQTMLAADKLLIAIEGINMSFSEFGYAMNQYQESSFFKTGNKLVQLQAQKDLSGLKKILTDYDDTESSKVYNRLNKLVIKVAIHGLDSDYVITNEEIEFLTTYLYSIEEWTEYELYIFGNTMTILSDKDLIFLGKAFVKRDKLYCALPSHKKNAEIVHLNLILILIEHKKFHHIDFFINNIEQLLTYQDMFSIVFLNFLKNLLAYVKGELTNLTSIKEYISMVEKLGNPTLATFLEIILEQIVI